MLGRVPMFSLFLDDDTTPLIPHLSGARGQGLWLAASKMDRLPTWDNQQPILIIQVAGGDSNVYEAVSSLTGKAAPGRPSVSVTKERHKQPHIMSDGPAIGTWQGVATQHCH